MYYKSFISWFGECACSNEDFGGGGFLVNVLVRIGEFGWDKLMVGSPTKLPLLIDKLSDISRGGNGGGVSDGIIWAAFWYATLNIERSSLLLSSRLKLYDGVWLSSGVDVNFEFATGAGAVVE